jgi:hemoglobin
MAGTLYEKYGGFKTVSRIVMDFYEEALDSDVIGDFFADVDMPRLIDHQTKFIASLMGGPASFSDERLAIVHRQLGIGHSDFDEVARLLARTLSAHGMAEADVQAVLQEVEAKRSLIVAADAA